MCNLHLILTITIFLYYVCRYIIVLIKMGQKFKYKFDWINYYYLNNNKLHLFKYSYILQVFHLWFRVT